MLLGPEDETLAAHELAAPDAQVNLGELRSALGSGLGEADAVGHRIVHGGERFHEAVRIAGDVESELRELAELAPLHQLKSLAALDAVGEVLSDVPAFACFDTAFHATLPPVAHTYALPAEWRKCWHLRRYGFHGLSHGWVARRAPELLAREPGGLRIVSCHLGAGASLCAICDGVSIDTTMGFTPLEGLVMATRSGNVDPGLLLWLLEHEQLSPGELTDALEHRSGLLGLTGTSDMRDVIARALRGDRDCELALDVYAHRLCGGIAAMAASLGGLDVLVFTGGVGERSALIRSRAAARLEFLGVRIEEPRNSSAMGDTDVSSPRTEIRTLVLSAREDLEIARQTRAVIRREGS